MFFWGFRGLLEISYALLAVQMDPPLPLPPNLVAFKKLIATSGKRIGDPAQKFVKKVDMLNYLLIGPAGQPHILLNGG